MKPSENFKRKRKHNNHSAFFIDNSVFMSIVKNIHEESKI